MTPATTAHTWSQIVAFAAAHPRYTIAFVTTAAILAGMLLFWWVLIQLDERAADEARPPRSTR